MNGLTEIIFTFYMIGFVYILLINTKRILCKIFPCKYFGCNLPNPRKQNKMVWGEVCYCKRCEKKNRTILGRGDGYIGKVLEEVKPNEK